MICVHDLRLSIDGSNILQGIDLTLADDDNLVVIGRSGSGKTMLIKTIMGFHHPLSGSITVDGVDVYSESSTAPKTAGKFAMVFQNAALLDSFTVYQNVALPLYYAVRNSRNSEEQRETVLNKVLQALDVVGMRDQMDKYPSELSGGMRKRVGIARALVIEPQYLIFDEPLSGLDPITASEVLFYITHVINSRQVRAITITHDMHQLDKIGDKVLFLEAGTQLFYGDIAELYRSPEPLIRQFVGGGA